MNRTFFSPGSLQLKAISIKLTSDPSGGTSIVGGFSVPTIVLGSTIQDTASHNLLGYNTITAPETLSIGDSSIDTVQVTSSNQINLNSPTTNVSGNLTAGTLSFTGTGYDLVDQAGDNLLSYDNASNPQTITIGQSGITSRMVMNGVYGNALLNINSPQMTIVDNQGNFGSQSIPSGGSGVTSVGPFGSTPNADGGSISGTTLTNQPASASFPGGVSTTTQSFLGAKTFTTSPLTVGTASGSQQFIVAGTTSSAVNIGGSGNVAASLTLGPSGGASGTTTIALQGAQNNINGNANGLNINPVGQMSLLNVFGVNPGGTIQPLLINNSGQLGTVSSTLKSKENIMDIEHNPILEFNAKKFNFIGDKETQYGFIAEEVEPHLPESIIYETKKDEQGKMVLDENGLPVKTTIPQSIAYHLLWPLLQDQVKKMANEMKRMRKEIEVISERPFKKTRIE
jgi:Phage spike trimer